MRGSSSTPSLRPSTSGQRRPNKLTPVRQPKRSQGSKSSRRPRTAPRHYAESKASACTDIGAAKQAILDEAERRRERQMNIEARAIANMLQEYFTIAQNTVDREKQDKEQKAQRLEKERKLRKRARKDAEEAKKKREHIERMRVEEKHRIEHQRRKMVIKRRQKEEELQQVLERKAKERQEKAEKQVEKRREKHVRRQRRIQEEERQNFRAMRERMRRDRLKQEDRKRRQEVERAKRLQDIEAKEAKAEVKKRRIKQQRIDEIRKKNKDMRQRHIRGSARRVELLEQRDVRNKQRSQEENEQRLHVLQKKVHKEIKLQRRKDQTVRDKIDLIAERNKILRLNKLNFSRTLHEKMKIKVQSAREKSLNMVVARQAWIKDTRKKSRSKMKRAASVTSVKQELARFKRIQAVEQNKRKQDFFRLMDQLTKKQSGFMRLKALGLDLKNPDPKVLNIANIMTLVDDKPLPPEPTPKHKL